MNVLDKVDRDLMEDITLKVNGIDLTEFLVLKNFRITHEVRRYRGSFILIIDKEYNKYIKTTNEIEVFLKNELIFGGVIFDINRRRLNLDKFEIQIDVREYTIYMNRRTINSLLDLEPEGGEGEKDRNNAGKYVERYLDRFLYEEGIRYGSIADGGSITDSDLEEFEIETIMSIINTLGDLTGLDSHISYDKKLFFGDMEYKPYHHTEPERELNEDNISDKHLGGFFNLEVNENIDNLANKIFIKGGIPDEDVPEENMTEISGDLFYVMQNQEYIDYLAGMNGGTGVWGYTIRDEKIHTLKDAEERARNELQNRSKMAINIRVSTYMNHFRPSDTMFVNLGSWGIHNQVFVVNRVSIRPSGNNIVYELELQNRLSVREKEEDLVVFIEKLVKEAKKKGTTIIKEGGPEDEYAELLYHIDFQQEEGICYSIDDDQGVKALYDLESGRTVFTQENPMMRPELVERKGFKGMLFEKRGIAMLEHQVIKSPSFFLVWGYDKDHYFKRYMYSYDEDAIDLLNWKEFWNNVAKEDDDVIVYELIAYDAILDYDDPKIDETLDYLQDKYG